MIGNGETQESPAELQQLRHEIAIDLIDSPGVFGGRVDRFNPLNELGLGLEESLLLAHDHGVPPGRGEHVGVVTDVPPEGNRFPHPLSS